MMAVAIEKTIMMILQLTKEQQMMKVLMMMNMIYKNEFF